MRIVVYVAALLLGVAGAQTAICHADEVVHIPDAGLRNAVQDTLGLLPPQPPVRDLTDPIPDPDITCRHIQLLTDLRASSPRHPVSSLEGLEYATNLATLRLDTFAVPRGNLFPHEIRHLESLRHLANLQSIFIHGSGEIDLGGLAGVPNLKRLVLIGVQVPDLTPLLHAEDMDSITLTFAGIRDLTALQYWEQPPAHLSLSHNVIHDPRPLTANPDFGTGHRIDLSYNCLPRTASSWNRETDIGILRARGVRVNTSHQFSNTERCQMTIPDY